MFNVLITLLGMVAGYSIGSGHVLVGVAAILVGVAAIYIMPRRIKR